MDHSGIKIEVPFLYNTAEEVKEKLSYLSSSLLLSKEEAYRLMCFVPVIRNESFEELKKKLEFQVEVRMFGEGMEEALSDHIGDRELSIMAVGVDV